MHPHWQRCWAQFRPDAAARPAYFPDGKSVELFQSIIDPSQSSLGHFDSESPTMQDAPLGDSAKD